MIPRNASLRAWRVRAACVRTLCNHITPISTQANIECACVCVCPSESANTSVCISMQQGRFSSGSHGIAHHITHSTPHLVRQQGHASVQHMYTYNPIVHVLLWAGAPRDSFSAIHALCSTTPIASVFMEDFCMTTHVHAA